MSTTAPSDRTDAHAPELPPSDSRVSFRQPVSPAGHIDGAWWPRSTDLTAELPALLDVLWTSARDINRVTFSLSSWAPAPRKVWIHGRRVHLGGFRSNDPLTVHLSDAWGRELIDLLVVGPDSDPEVADAAMRLASAADNENTVGQIMSQARDGAGHGKRPA